MAAEPPEPASSLDAQLAVSSSSAAAGVGGPNPCCAKVVDPPSSHHYAASCLVRFLSYSLTSLHFWGVLLWGLPVWVGSAAVEEVPEIGDEPDGAAGGGEAPAG